MEKLVLRGIMYGADKIPDSCFEKVPGGFYKQKEQERRQHEKDEKRRNRRERSRRRRHSDEYEDRRSRYDEDPYEADRPARATERRRRDARSKSSYDGGDDYDPEDEERQRRRSRRNTYGNDERYGYKDGFTRHDSVRRSYAPNGSSNDASPTGGQTPAHDPYSHSGVKRNSAAAAAASAGTAAATAQQSQRHTSYTPPIVPSTAPMQSPVAVSYIPYSNIYGSSAAPVPGARQMFSPPPASSLSSVQPNSINQVTPVIPLANTYDYPPANTSYDARGFHDPHHAPYSRQQDPYVPSRSPSPSFDSTATPPRRARSERRPNRDKERTRGKSFSRLQEKLDLSQHGLGYSAIGAVAGGLVGSSMGRGRLPAAIGAAIGGIGANTLGASQRSVDPRNLPPPPPGPPSYFKSRQEMSGSRDDRRTSEWALDQNMTSKREARERARYDEADRRGNRSE